MLVVWILARRCSAAVPQLRGPTVSSSEGAFGRYLSCRSIAAVLQGDDMKTIIGVATLGDI